MEGRCTAKRIERHDLVYVSGNPEGNSKNRLWGNKMREKSKSRKTKLEGLFQVMKDTLISRIASGE